MRILFLSELFIRNETFRNVIANLGRSYARRGHEVVAAGPLLPRSGPRRAPESFNWGRARWLGGFPRGSPGRAKDLCAEIAPLLRTADAVHLNLIGFWSPGLERVFALVSRSPAPVVVSFHDYGNPSVMLRNPDAIRGFRPLLRRCASVTALSHFGAHILLQDFPFLKGKLDVVPEGCDNFRPMERAKSAAPRGPYVLCPARMAFYKGIDILLMAWAGLPPSAPRLVFAGGEDRPSPSREFVERLGLEDRVEFPGLIGHRRLLGWMAGSEFVVLPSRHEFFGMAALEAMSMGKAVLATKTGPADFIEDGVSGLLVPPGRLEPLRSAALALIQDRALRRRLERAARETARDYAWPDVADRYLSLLGDSRKRAIVST